MNLTNGLLQDLRYALGQLRKSPGFTAVAVLTLALGIGVNATFFTAYDGVALKLLPVKDADGLFRVEQSLKSGATGDPQFFFSYPEYLFYEEHNRELSSLIAASPLIPLRVIAPGDAPENGKTLQGQIVSGNYFSSLASDAAVGRLFGEEDDKPESGPVLVLSHSYWQRELRADRSILGTTLQVNDVAFTIVGVAPQDFIGSGAPPLVPDFWAPTATQGQLEPEQAWANQANDGELQLLARLRPGVTPSQGAAEFLLLAQQWGRANNHHDTTIAIALEPATYFGETNTLWFRGVAGLLMALIGLVLLIGCANLANMLLARGNMRTQEIAVRRALGASRERLIRQLLTESILLGLSGGVGGLLLSLGLSHFLGIALAAQSRSVFGTAVTAIPMTVDGWVFAYTLLLSLCTAALFGVYPALHFSKAGAIKALKGEGTTFGKQIGGSRVRSLLVGGQFAISLFLLISAGLLMQGLLRSLTIDPGYETKRVFFVGLNTGPHPSLALQKRVIGRLVSLPNVASVAISYRPPGTGTFTPPTIVEGRNGSQSNFPGGALGNYVSRNISRL